MLTLLAVLGLWPCCLLPTCRNADKRRLGNVAVLDLDRFTCRHVDPACCAGLVALLFAANMQEC